MKVLKAWYHFLTLIKKIFLKLLYGNRIQFGKSVSWRKGFSVLIENGAFVSIGNNCFFNNYCSLASNLLIEIGSGCLFGENVKIYDHNHRFNKDIPIKIQGFSNGEVHIGNNCWVGSNVTILKGTTIGDHCVIGAGCVIDGEIPPYSIVKSKRQYEIDVINLI